MHMCPRNFTGRYKLANWNSKKRKWPLLAPVECPEPAQDAGVDILIGVDYSILRRSIVDLYEEDRTGPLARLGSLR